MTMTAAEIRVARAANRRKMKKETNPEILHLCQELEDLYAAWLYRKKHPLPE